VFIGGIRVAHARDPGPDRHAGPSHGVGPPQALSEGARQDLSRADQGPEGLGLPAHPVAHRRGLGRNFRQGVPVGELRVSCSSCRNSTPTSLFAVLAEERGFIGAMLAARALFRHHLPVPGDGPGGARTGSGSSSPSGWSARSPARPCSTSACGGHAATTGVPLPLMSYGGSSLASTLLGMGLVLNVWMRRLVN